MEWNWSETGCQEKLNVGGLGAVKKGEGIRKCLWDERGGKVFDSFWKTRKDKLVQRKTRRCGFKCLCFGTCPSEVRQGGVSVLDVALKELWEGSRSLGNPPYDWCGLVPALFPNSVEEEEEEAVARWLDSSPLHSRAPGRISPFCRYASVLMPCAITACLQLTLRCEKGSEHDKLLFLYSTWGGRWDYIGARSRGHWKSWGKMEKKTSNSVEKERSCLESGGNFKHTAEGKLKTFNNGRWRMISHKSNGRSPLSREVS